MISLDKTSDLFKGVPSSDVDSVIYEFLALDFQQIKEVTQNPEEVDWIQIQGAAIRAVWYPEGKELWNFIPRVARWRRTKNLRRVPFVEKTKNGLLAFKDVVLAKYRGEKVLLVEAAIEKRKKICAGCDRYDPHVGECTACGCPVVRKAHLATSNCPLGYWPMVSPEDLGHF